MPKAIEQIKKTVILKNNLEVILSPHQGSRTTIIGFVVDTGTGVEEGFFPNGINHIVEKLFWFGTDKYTTARQLSVYLEAIGATIHSSVSFESFQIYLEVPDYNASKAITLLADIIQNSHFESSDVENIKKQLKERYFSSADSVNWNEGRDYLQNYLYWQVEESSQSFLSLESLMSIKREDVLDYIAHQFHPSRCKLVINGNTSSNLQLMELIDQEWSFWNVKNKRFVDCLELRHEEWVLNLPHINYRQRGSYNTEIHFGFLVDSNPHSRFYDTETGARLDQKSIEKILPQYLLDNAKLMILNQILGTGLSSKLWLKGVEEDMLFSAIGSEFNNLNNLQYIYIYGVSENNQFTFSLESVLGVLENLKRSTISIHEISRAREAIKSKLVMMQDNPLVRTVWETENYLKTGAIIAVEDYIAALTKVQASEIRSISIDIFNPNRLIGFILGTSKETRIVDKLVSKHLN
jgi:predicted Zn-dependent peptidase